MEHKVNFKIVAPVAAVLLAFAISLIILPAVKAAPKEIPFGIVSLDQGVTTPQGQVVLGPQVAAGIKAQMESAFASMDPAPLALVALADQAALDQGFEARDFYGALVLPKDFTAVKLAGGTPSLELILDQGQSPQVAAAVEKMLGGMVAQGGFDLKVTYLHPVGSDLAGGNANLLAFILTWLATFVSSIMIYVGFSKAPAMNIQNKLAQTGMAALVACLISLTVSFILIVEFGFGIDFATIAVYLLVAVVSLMLMILGILNWIPKVGGALLVLMLLLGLVASNLPYELLPVFWQDYIYPWIPMRFLGDGIKEIFYMDGSAWNESAKTLAVIGAGGAALLLLSALKPGGGRIKDH
jgi:hypothetical protein